MRYKFALVNLFIYYLSIAKVAVKFIATLHERGRKMEKSRETKHSVIIEIGNAITHGIGLALAVAGLVLLILKAVHTGSPMRIVTFTIYGSTSYYFIFSLHFIIRSTLPKHDEFSKSLIMILSIS